MSKEIAFNIRSKNEEIETHSTVLTEIAKRHQEALAKREELVGQIDYATEETIEELEKNLEVVDQIITDIEAEQEEADKKKKKLDEDLEELQKELDEIQEEPEEGKGEERHMNKDLELRKQAVEDYIRTRALPADGVVQGDIGVVIPEEIIYTPQNEVGTEYDLSNLVTVVKVNTASGKYPVLKKNKQVLNTVAELEKNPKLIKPEFEMVDWAVETYRGALALSREAIDDAAIDITGVVASQAKDAKRHTKNAKIAAAFKTFTAKDAVGTDGLKDILNLAIDPAYNTRIVASQTFYNELDKLKDKNGRYLLQDNIAFASGKSLFQKEVVVISDELIGAGKAFIGDTKQAVFIADRTDIGVRWADNDIYGELLMAGMRMDVKKADKNSGFYVTLKP